ncbi:MAG: septum site-determining protein MinD [Clostridia bacterium]|nr:septum site-determining protein MinD [Clostridia bacterium]
MARNIVITSGKGGVGKTTVAACLSAQLARKGQRVILCDADFGLNNIDVVTGIEHLVTYDVIDVIEGRCRAKQALVKHPDFSNLYILTSSHSAPERYVSPQSLKVVLDGLAPQFDFVIIDCPAGIDDGFHRAVACADEAIVVATPHVSSLRDADKVITLLKSYRLRSLSVVVNKLRGDLLLSGESLSPSEIEKLLKLPVLGLVPEEYAIYGGEFTDLHPAFRMLAGNLMTGKNKLFDVTKKYSGVLGNLRRLLKRRL